jgi:hypothetical protein
VALRHAGWYPGTQRETLQEGFAVVNTAGKEAQSILRRTVTARALSDANIRILFVATCRTLGSNAGLERLNQRHCVRRGLRRALRSTLRLGAAGKAIIVPRARSRADVAAILALALLVVPRTRVVLSVSLHIGHGFPLGVGNFGLSQLGSLAVGRWQTVRARALVAVRQVLASGDVRGDRKILAFGQVLHGSRLLDSTVI